MADAKSKYVLQGEDRTGKAFDSVSKRARETANRVAAAAVAAGTAITAAGVAIVNSNRQSIDSLAKTSDKLGITTEKLIGLRHAAEQASGMAGEQFDMALQRMVRRVAEAAEGTGEAAGAIKELRLNAEDLARLSPDKQMAVIADAMADVSNQGERVRLAMKFFDSEGVALVNTLAQGSVGLNKFQAEAEALGITLSRVDAAKVEAANDSIDRAMKVAAGFGQALTVAVAPAIEGVANRLTAAAAEAGGFDAVATTAVDNLLSGTGKVLDVMDAVGRSFEVAGLTITGTFARAEYRILGVVNAVVQAEAKLKGFFRELTPDEQAFTKNLAAAVDEARQISEFAAEDIAAILNRPMPSAAFDEFILEARESSQLAAELAAGAHATTEEQMRAHAAIMAKINADKNNRLLAQEAASQQAQLTLQQKSDQARLKQDMSTFGSAMSNAARHNKTFFKLNKMAEIANGVLSLRSTIMSSYRFGAMIGGPPLGVIMAGIGGAAQIANIAALKATSFGGGGSGGGGGGSTAIPSVSSMVSQAQQQDQTGRGGGTPQRVMVEFEGDDDTRIPLRVLRDRMRRMKEESPDVEFFF